MAWLQADPSGNYRVSFRFGGRKFKRSLRTTSQAEAEGRRLRLEENIRFVESGRLVIPPEADAPTFLLFDGKLNNKVVICLFLTLDEIDDLLQHVKESARQPFIFPMFVMAAHTCARRSELLRSQITDFNSDTITIRERKRVRGKQSTRRVPLSAVLPDGGTQIH